MYDATFQQQNHKVVLVVETAQLIQRLVVSKRFNCVFFHPMTKKIDRWIKDPSALKVRYRSRIIQMIIKAINCCSKRCAKNQHISCNEMLELSWEDVTKSTVRNCFAKAEILTGEQTKAQYDLHAPFIE